MAAKKETAKGTRLLEFYGTECVHCKPMEPIIKRVEEAAKVKITRLETWHNAANEKLHQELDDGFCGGVPFFYNEKTKEKLCGEIPYDKLLKWATKK